MSDDTREFIAALVFCAFTMFIFLLPSILTALR